MNKAPASYEEARSAIMDYVQKHWRKPAVAPAVEGEQWLPTEFENRAFTPPKAATWARCTMQWGESGAASIGTGHRRTIAVVFVQIFQKIGAGQKETNQAIDKLAEVLDYLQLTTEHCDISFDTVARTTVGQQAEGWYQSNAFARVIVDARDPHERPVAPAGGELLYMGIFP